MNVYVAYNCGLALLVVPFVIWFSGRRLERVLQAARIALLITVLAYPWDFFAIHLNVWTYPRDPGPRLHTVPLNDLVFMWLCSLLACSLIITLTDGNDGSQRNSECENAREEGTRQD